MADPPLVRIEIAPPRATITLDSPANRNALSKRLVTELRDHLDAADAETGVRCIVLTHTGSTFSAGADMAEALSGGMQQSTARIVALLSAIASTETPVVAVVRGHVRAGGIGIVGVSDLVVSSVDASYAFTEVRLGLAPAVVSLTTSPRMLDRDVQRKYLTGEVFDGAEAARCGLVTVSCAAEDVDGVVDGLVGQLAAAPRQGLAETKRLLNQALVRRLESEGPVLAGWSARLFGSDEAQNAMRSFRERRTPADG
jgi:enoyl-CoA hydratase/carnithine racemase